MANTNQYVNNNAKSAMHRMKYEIASQVGVNLKEGYNGDLPASQAGKIGGNMVKRMISDAQNMMAK
jgi:hypothetical protein